MVSLRAAGAAGRPGPRRCAEPLDSERAILRRVTLPLLRPALAGAGLLVLMTSLATFSAPYLVGGGFRVMTTPIVVSRLNGDVRLALVEAASG
jgi:iron(III) transport system permease protein